MSKFIIINEWDTVNGSGEEIVGACYYDTEDEAWDALSLVAESHLTTLPKDETSFVVVQNNERYESYYIEELVKGGE